MNPGLRRRGKALKSGMLALESAVRFGGFVFAHAARVRVPAKVVLPVEVMRETVTLFERSL